MLNYRTAELSLAWKSCAIFKYVEVKSLVCDVKIASILFLCAFAQLRECLLSSLCPPSCRPSRMCQLGFHWTEFHEI